MTTYKLKISLKNPALWLFLIAMFITVPVSSAKAEAQGVFNTLSEEQQNKVLEKVRDELLALQTWNIDRQKAEEKTSKSLKELLKEQAKDDDKAKKMTPGGKVFNHSKEYAKLAGKFIANNLTGFSQVAGEVSAGDYTKAKKLVPEWGAAAFGKLASDALESYGYPKTKTVWDELIGNSSSLKKVTIALASGNAANLDKVFWEETQVVGKKYSKKIAANVLNWIFSDINAGWDELTGKLPSLNVSVGDVYVALVEAEVELIQVGKNYLKQKRAGKCLDLYINEYDRLNGDIGAAYREFELCDISTMGSASYFREIEVYITKGNKNPQVVYIAMLEAYRQYRTWPDVWLKKRLKSRKKKIQNKVNSGLRTTQQRVETISVGFMGALQVRLNQLAWEEMTEEVKDDLEMQLAAILNEINPKLKRMRERRDKTLARCAAYDAAEARAGAALGRGEEVSIELSRLELDIESLPSCDSAGYVMGQLAPLVTRAEAERQTFESYIGVMKQAVRDACNHAGSVKTAASKSEAREHVDKCQDAAREAANAIEKARAGIAKLSKTRDGAAKIAESVNEDRLTNVMEEL